ncbi:hypothetical protein Pmani_005223 [Petrolisthes manimaculis]|uniref:C2H2-type domain-containing protein n=1 Tax=Petrolisthes manimaculis TaxID=1843537 RepID=A0AAE1QCW8_9EUCA|nr:hypothetical protein Pmani_005223 [Petrolisthes manimaculis]
MENLTKPVKAREVLLSDEFFNYIKKELIACDSITHHEDLNKRLERILKTPPDNKTSLMRKFQIMSRLSESSSGGGGGGGGNDEVLCLKHLDQMFPKTKVKRWGCTGMSSHWNTTTTTTTTTTRDKGSSSRSPAVGCGGNNSEGRSSMKRKLFTTGLSITGEWDKPSREVVHQQRKRAETRRQNRRDGKRKHLDFGSTSMEIKNEWVKISKKKRLEWDETGTNEYTELSLAAPRGVGTGDSGKSSRRKKEYPNIRPDIDRGNKISTNYNSKKTSIPKTPYRLEKNSLPLPQPEYQSTSLPVNLTPFQQVSQRNESKHLSGNKYQRVSGSEVPKRESCQFKSSCHQENENVYPQSPLSPVTPPSHTTNTTNTTLENNVSRGSSSIVSRNTLSTTPLFSYTSSTDEPSPISPCVSLASELPFQTPCSVKEPSRSRHEMQSAGQVRDEVLPTYKRTPPIYHSNDTQKKNNMHLAVSGFHCIDMKPDDVVGNRCSVVEVSHSKPKDTARLVECGRQYRPRAITDTRNVDTKDVNILDSHSSKITSNNAIPITHENNRKDSLMKCGSGGPRFTHNRKGRQNPDKRNWQCGQNQFSENYQARQNLGVTSWQFRQNQEILDSKKGQNQDILDPKNGLNQGMGIWYCGQKQQELGSRQMEHNQEIGKWQFRQDQCTKGWQSGVKREVYSQQSEQNVSIMNVEGRQNQDRSLYNWHFGQEERMGNFPCGHSQGMTGWQGGKNQVVKVWLNEQNQGTKYGQDELQRRYLKKNSPGDQKHEGQLWKGRPDERIRIKVHTKLPPVCVRDSSGPILQPLELSKATTTTDGWESNQQVPRGDSQSGSSLGVGKVTQSKISPSIQPDGLTLSNVMRNPLQKPLLTGNFHQSCNPGVSPSLELLVENLSQGQTRNTEPKSHIQSCTDSGGIRGIYIPACYPDMRVTCMDTRGPVVKYDDKVKVVSENSYSKLKNGASDEKKDVEYYRLSGNPMMPLQAERKEWKQKQNRFHPYNVPEKCLRNELNCQGINPSFGASVKLMKREDSLPNFVITSLSDPPTFMKLFIPKKDKEAAATDVKFDAGLAGTRWLVTTVDEETKGSSLLPDTAKAGKGEDCEFLVSECRSRYMDTADYNPLYATGNMKTQSQVCNTGTLNSKQNCGGPLNNQINVDANTSSLEINLSRSTSAPECPESICCKNSHKTTHKGSICKQEDFYANQGMNNLESEPLLKIKPPVGTNVDVSWLGCEPSLVSTGVPVRPTVDTSCVGYDTSMAGLGSPGVPKCCVSDHLRYLGGIVDKTPVMKPCRNQFGENKSTFPTNIDAQPDQRVFMPVTVQGQHANQLDNQTIHQAAYTSDQEGDVWVKSNTSPGQEADTQGCSGSNKLGVKISTKTYIWTLEQMNISVPTELECVEVSNLYRSLKLKRRVQPYCQDNLAPDSNGQSNSPPTKSYLPTSSSQGTEYLKETNNCSSENQCGNVGELMAAAQTDLPQNPCNKQHVPGLFQDSNSGDHVPYQLQNTFSNNHQMLDSFQNRYDTSSQLSLEQNGCYSSNPKYVFQNPCVSSKQISPLPQNTCDHFLPSNTTQNCNKVLTIADSTFSMSQNCLRNTQNHNVVSQNASSMHQNCTNYWNKVWTPQNDNYQNNSGVSQNLQAFQIESSTPKYDLKGVGNDLVTYQNLSSSQNNISASQKDHSTLQTDQCTFRNDLVTHKDCKTSLPHSTQAWSLGGSNNVMNVGSFYVRTQASSCCSTPYHGSSGQICPESISLTDNDREKEDNESAVRRHNLRKEPHNGRENEQKDSNNNDYLMTIKPDKLYLIDECACPEDPQASITESPGTQRRDCIGDSSLRENEDILHLALKADLFDVITCENERQYSWPAIEDFASPSPSLVLLASPPASASCFALSASPPVPDVSSSAKSASPVLPAGSPPTLPTSPLTLSTSPTIVSESLPVRPFSSPFRQPGNPWEQLDDNDGTYVTREIPLNTSTTYHHGQLVEDIWCPLEDKLSPKEINKPREKSDRSNEVTRRLVNEVYSNKEKMVQEKSDGYQRSKVGCFLTDEVYSKGGNQALDMRESDESTEVTYVVVDDRDSREGTRKTREKSDRRSVKTTPMVTEGSHTNLDDTEEEDMECENQELLEGETHADQLPFRCEFCGRLFKHKRSRDRHVKLHTGDKKYKCCHCEAAFSRSDHLKIHKKTHDTQKPYQCTVCNRGYNTAAALTAHMQNHKAKLTAHTLNQLLKDAQAPGESHTLTHLLREPPGDSHSQSFNNYMKDSQKEQQLLSPRVGELGSGSSPCELTASSPLGEPSPSLSPAATLRCPICHANCRNHAHLQRHLARHHGEDLQERPGSRSGGSGTSSLGGASSAASTPSPRPPSSLPSPRPLSNPLLSLVGGKLACYYCSRDGFPSLEALQLHLQSSHGSVLNGEVRDMASMLGLPHSLGSSLGAAGLQTSLVSPLGPGSSRGVSCELCGARVGGVTALQRHVVTAHTFTDLLARAAEGVFCAQCLLPFSNPGALTEHIKLVHASPVLSAVLNKRPPSPPTDIPTDLSKKSRHDSLTSDLPASTLLCSQCNAPFTNFEAFRRHLKSHLDGADLSNNGSSSTQLVCPECRLPLTSEASLETHLASHLGVTSTEYGCQACLKLFSKPDELQKHLMDIHAHHLYRCALCKEMFDSKVSIQVHFAVKHSNECKVHKCTRCSLIFRSQPEFEGHIRGSHMRRGQGGGEGGTGGGMGGPGGSYRCLLCTLSLSSEAELAAHVATHQRQFQCSLCDDAFHVEFLLDKHMQTQHNSELNGNIPQPENLAKPRRSPLKKDYRCDICDAEFSSDSSLVNHRKQAHNIKSGGMGITAKVAAASLSLFCAYCSEACKSRADLEAHMKTHQGNGGRHKCNICDELCPSAALLAQHKLTHVKVVSGSACAVCREPLTSEQQFTSHQNDHHPAPLPQPCVVCRQTLVTDMEVSVHARFHAAQAAQAAAAASVASGVYNSGELLPPSTSSIITTAAIASTISTNSSNNGRSSISPRLSPSLRCNECHLKLETLEEAEAHAAVHHQQQGLGRSVPSSSRTYQCIKCQESFASEAEIEAHVASHLLHEGSVHECHLCHATFDTPLRLQCHLIEHTFEGCGSFTCYMCSSVFTTASRLQQHMVEHGLSARPYDCHHCHQRFFFRAELENHALSHPEATEGGCRECLASYPDLPRRNVRRQSLSCVATSQLMGPQAIPIQCKSETRPSRSASPVTSRSEGEGEGGPTNGHATSAAESVDE